MRQPPHPHETVTIHVPFRFAKRGGRKEMVPGLWSDAARMAYPFLVT